MTKEKMINNFLTLCVLCGLRGKQVPKLISARSKTFHPFPKDTMKITIPKNRMEIKHFPKDLAFVILFTLLCIPFVLIPPLNEISPIRIILGLPLVLFLPGYSLIATLFPRKDDLDAIERIALSFGLSIAITPLLGLTLNYTPFGIRLSPVLIVLSVFTISLAIGAYVRRNMIPEGDRFVVDKPLQGFRGRGAEPHIRKGF